MAGERFYFTVVDGPNLINRLLEHGYRKKFILNNFSLDKMNSILIQEKVRLNLGSSRTLGIDFFCSTKSFGSKENKFTREETDSLLDKFRREYSVSVHHIGLPSSSGQEKGVDVSVVTKMFEMLDICETIVLVSSDKDYVPALEVLKRKGVYVVTVGFDDESHPIELRNVSLVAYRKLLVICSLKLRISK